MKDKFDKGHKPFRPFKEPEITDELEEVKVEYVYLTIPAEYICIYHKLVMAVSEMGKDIIDDCNYTCQNKGKNIVNCWNLFQSAVANYNLGNYKEANFYIKYIDKQIELIYKNDKHVYPTSMPVKITPDGRLHATVSCCSQQRFYVDAETGKLYREFNNKKECAGGKYDINNNNLTFTRYE